MQTSKDKNYYNVLGAARDADEKTLKKCFREAALVHHPDKGGNDSDF
jgi:curved DNA-binding protein CbpA